MSWLRLLLLLQLARLLLLLLLLLLIVLEHANLLLLHQKQLASEDCPVGEACELRLEGQQFSRHPRREPHERGRHARGAGRDQYAAHA